MLEKTTLLDIVITVPWRPNQYSNQETNFKLLTIALLRKASLMFQNVTIKDLGIVLAVIGIHGPGLDNRTIIPNDNANAVCTVNVDVILFAPFIGEVLDARIVAKDDNGLTLHPLFQDGADTSFATPSIHIGKSGFKLGTRLRKNEEMEWSWKTDGEVFFMTVGCTMRCRVESITFKKRVSTMSSSLNQRPSFSSSYNNNNNNSNANLFDDTGYEMIVEAHINGSSTLGLVEWYLELNAEQEKAWDDDKREVEEKRLGVKSSSHHHHHHHHHHKRTKIIEPSATTSSTTTITTTTIASSSTVVPSSNNDDGEKIQNKDIESGTKKSSVVVAITTSGNLPTKQTSSNTTSTTPPAYQLDRDESEGAAALLKMGKKASSSNSTSTTTATTRNKGNHKR
jgi:DNA-directed RNA polymerase subunit E'/Rpb7